MIEDLICVNTMTAVLVVSVTCLYWWFSRRTRGIPLGPRVYPVLGSLPSLMSRDVMKNFECLRQKYGDVYSLYIGQELTVILNGYDVIYEALIKKGNVFSVRPRTQFHKMMFKTPGIVFANGTVWKEQRQFAQRALHEFGYNWTYKTIEDRINDEVGFFIKRIGEYGGPFNSRETTNLSVANVIAGILFGKRYSYDDPKFISCLDGVGEAAKLFAKSSILMSFFPFLRFLPGDLLNLNKIEHIRAKPQLFLDVPFSEHLIGFKDGHIRDVVDLYIQAIRENESSDSKNTFTGSQMRSVMGELLSAGSETTATSILWIILYLVRNPELQARLQSDIDRVIPIGEQPSLSDRNKLSLVEATILEGLRIAPAAPLSVPHAVHTDVKYRGYLIPKDTTVLVNLHSVLKDPTIWTQPDEFRPERFLDGQGSLTIPKEFIPFSLGRRSCLGESLARMELFLYITALVQNFDLRSPKGQSPPSLNGHLGMTFSPLSFEIETIPRNRF